MSKCEKEWEDNARINQVWEESPNIESEHEEFKFYEW